MIKEAFVFASIAVVECAYTEYNVTIEPILSIVEKTNNSGGIHFSYFNIGHPFCVSLFVLYTSRALHFLAKYELNTIEEQTITECMYVFIK